MSTMEASGGTPDVYMDRNVRLFVLYRVLFNLRFYYPVFALFYLDAGISREDFGLLQAFWSAGIIMFEVPSGIVADLIGRTKTLRLGAFLAIVEMVIFALSTTFWGFMVNRVISGFNESLVSGADSAFLYDSLKVNGRQEEYKKILGRAQFFGLVCGSFASIVGSYAYTLQIRIPIWITALCMVSASLTSFFFREPPMEKKRVTVARQWEMLRKSFIDISSNKQLIFLIGFIFAVDCTIRIIVVNNSLYFKSILIPVMWFGVIGVGAQLLSSIVAKNAYRIDRSLGFGGSAFAAGCIILAGAAGISLMIPYVGLIFPIMLLPVMFYSTLNTEGEINKRIPSERRATILSIKNLTLNIGFAGGMIPFSWGGDESLKTSYWGLTVFFLGMGLVLLVSGRRLWKQGRI